MANRLSASRLQPSVSTILKTFAAFFVLNVGTFLMVQLVVTYSSFDDQAGFLKEKQAYIHLPVWKTAFYVHVFTSILALMAGFTQFSARILAHHRWLHRLFGRVYAIVILLINFPAGLVMAVCANGGTTSRAAFLILDLLWFGFTLKAVLEARRGRISEHRDYMLRSYALTLSALTLRTWKIILTNTTDLPPETIYMIDAWLGFVPNWLCAEWIIASRRRSASTSKKHPEDRHHSNKESDEADDKTQNASCP